MHDRVHLNLVAYLENRWISEMMSTKCQRDCKTHFSLVSCITFEALHNAYTSVPFSPAGPPPGPNHIYQDLSQIRELMTTLGNNLWLAVKGHIMGQKREDLCSSLVPQAKIFPDCLMNSANYRGFGHRMERFPFCSSFPHNIQSHTHRSSANVNQFRDV